MKSNIGQDIMMDRRVLVHTFKLFQLEPLRIFTVRDFAKSDPKRFKTKYLNTLIGLGLIEEVDVVYNCGANFNTKRHIKGYKLKSKII